MRGAQWSEDVEEREENRLVTQHEHERGESDSEDEDVPLARGPLFHPSGDVAVEGRWDKEKEGEEGEQHPAEEREPHLGQGVRWVVEEQEWRTGGERTYDDNGNVIPLPLDGPAPGPSKERLAEIRRYDKEQFEKQQRREKRADQGIHTLVCDPGEVMAPVGRPVRARRAPLDANAAQELLDAKLMERFRAKKRKESENAAPAPKNKK
ncbi:hypothetical protein B0H14DRAFT_3436743 [Mycena olivaceomarginata]|nr:hypothetical protein B0H14DRAFT_3436743 [Mycena olivaceomarginata]